MVRSLQACVVVLTCLASAGVVRGGDFADAAQDPVDVPAPAGGDVEHDEGDLLHSAGDAELVVEATLAKGLSFVPAPKRVVNTAYVFRVDKLLGGRSPGEYVVVYDTGGVLRDGRKMDTVESFKLSPGDRYLVFARRVEGEYWCQNVLQVGDDGRTVADASGRAVVGVDEGRLVVQPQRTRKVLRYTVPVETAPPKMDAGPSAGSLPLPAQPESAQLDDAQPLTLEQVEQYVRQASQGTPENRSVPVQPRDDEGAGDEPGDVPGERTDAPPRDFTPGATESRPSGHHVAAFQSHFHFMPENQNWSWAAHSRGSWDVLVNPKNGFRLFAYKIDGSGSPIRNRLPVANDRNFNVGVLSDAQMTNGGYDSWTSLGANGVCYRWWNTANRVVETDILVNPAIAGDEAQFRKSFTHEYGHALTLDHERRHMALMYPGTFQQPPNYASLWYTRRDDHVGVRSMLDWVNGNVAAGTWDVARFADVATWSQAHASPGTDGSLVMTSVSKRTFAPGDTATVRNVHVENRGNLPAQNTVLKFYLSGDRVVSSGDREIASYTWSTLNTYWSGDLAVRVPPGTPRGTYFLGWKLTADAAEISASNNTALLLNDRGSGFSPVTVRVQ